MADVRFLLTGDTSVCVEFGNEISEAINAKIRAYNIALQNSKIPGIVETVPTYRSLMILYDPEVILCAPLMEELRGLLGKLDQIRIPPSEVIEIPVLYGGEEMGPPRVKIPAGSVGIAGSQTGVYPIDSPGGWQLIGRTPVRMYDAGRAKPILPEAGQYIKFCAIDRAEFDRIAAQEAAGGYTCRRCPRKEAEQ